ncbi:MAG: TonB family protein [Endomicrobiales bacterium]|nr:TonB family protein [Endomicrobiales bacterium]
MENDLKVALVLSIIVHLSIFLLTSFRSRRIIYVNIPVDLFFYTTPAPPAEVKEQAPPKEEEIVIPKKPKKKAEKKKEEKKVTEKKEKPAPEPKPEPKQLTPSSQISLESAKFPYAYYTNMIVKKISQNWQWSVDFGELKAVLYFRIQRDGNIDSLEIKTSSGDKLFDKQALRAVEISSPFPPLPFSYDEKDLGVFFEFSFKE